MSEDTPSIKLLRKLKKFRDFHRLSYRQIAAMTGIEHNTIYKYLEGVHEPSYNNGKVIEEVMEMGPMEEIKHLTARISQILEASK